MPASTPPDRAPHIPARDTREITDAIHPIPPGGVVPVTTTRKKPPKQKPAATRGKTAAKKPTKGKKQRRYAVQNPVQFRRPVVRNKRRPKRKTTVTVGSVLTAVLFVLVSIVFSVVAGVITGLITGVATGIAAARSEPSPPKQQPAGAQPNKQASTVSGAKQPPPGSVPCHAPTRRNGPCSRFTTPGQNCGIPGHPPPVAQGAP